MGAYFTAGFAHLALPALSVVLLLPVHVAITRLTKGSVFIGFLWSWLVVSGAIITVMTPEVIASNSAYGLADLLVDLGIFSGLAYAYMDFISFGYSSVRTKILDVLTSHGPLSHAGLLEHYNAKYVVDQRLDRLVASGQLKQSNSGQYRLGEAKKQIVLARVYLAFRWLLFGSAAATATGLRDAGGSDQTS